VGFRIIWRGFRGGIAVFLLDGGAAGLAGARDPITSSQKFPQEGVGRRAVNWLLAPPSDGGERRKLGEYHVASQPTGVSHFVVVYLLFLPPFPVRMFHAHLSRPCFPPR